MRAPSLASKTILRAVAGIVLSAVLATVLFLAYGRRSHPLAALENEGLKVVLVSRYGQSPIELDAGDARQAADLLLDISAVAGQAEDGVKPYQFLGDDPGRFHIRLASGRELEALVIWSPMLAYLFVDGVAYPVDEPKGSEEDFSALVAIVERAVPSDEALPAQK